MSCAGGLKFIGVIEHGARSGDIPVTSLPQNLLHNFPACDAYVLPARGPTAEFESLMAHASDHIEAKRPAQEEIDKWISSTEKLYRFLPERPRHLDDDVTDDAIRAKLMSFLHNAVNPDAGPGIPFNTEFNTNAQLLKDPKLCSRVIGAAFRRLKVLCGADAKGKTAMQLVRDGMVDPVRIFVKNEPHKRKKADLKRWRIISSISIVDSLVERYLSNDLNKFEIANWGSIPSKPGITLTSRSDLNSIVRSVRSMKNAFAGDVSGWDWSVQGWELEACAKSRANRQKLSSDSKWRKAIMNRAACVSLSVFVLSDGRAFEQTIPGIQLSGCFDTSAGNSFMRSLVSQACGSVSNVCMGDDCVEDAEQGISLGDFEQRYLAIGHRIRDVKIVSDDKGVFEFCSLRLGDDSGVTPVTTPKILTKLLLNLTKPPPQTSKIELVSQFLMEMRDTPREYIEGWLDRMQVCGLLSEEERACAGLFGSEF